MKIKAAGNEYGGSMPKTVENINDVGMREVVCCPKCGSTVHPEYLTYITATGEIVWCGFCKAPLLANTTTA